MQAPCGSQERMPPAYGLLLAGKLAGKGSKEPDVRGGTCYNSCAFGNHSIRFRQLFERRQSVLSTCGTAPTWEST